MFIENQPKEQRERYGQLLKAAGALSGLFSASDSPYIVYRTAESLFCTAFEATDRSRSDLSADATKDGWGFGIKTFLHKGGNSFEKIAEFNKQHSLFRTLEGKAKIEKIAELRNFRLEATRSVFGLDRLIYHCITRKPGKIIVYETDCPFIDLNKIGKIDVKENAVRFSDSVAEYSFNIAKSTLYKRFTAPKQVLLEVPVEIFKNPFDEINKLLTSTELFPVQRERRPFIFLPLYSLEKGKKIVPKKSGLNQWNAQGRKRAFDEVYIPIPIWIHRKFPQFFPPQETPFQLKLPDGKVLSAKLCQQNSKALMSNPNADLGNWILRDVLKVPENELVTYERLQAINTDTVVVRKNQEGVYDINFAPIDSYEEFRRVQGESREDSGDE